MQDAFGARAAEMYEIQGLATAPKAQGRGYGKALVKTITDMVRPLSLRACVRGMLNWLRCRLTRKGAMCG